MSASPFCSSSSWVDGSLTWRITMRFSLVAAPGVASSTTLSLAFHDRTAQAFDPAEAPFSQPLPKSSFCAWLIASFFSTTLPTLADRQYSRKVGAFASAICITSVWSSIALMRAVALSLLKPNWVRMKPGALSMITARCSDHSTSCAVMRLPEANLRPWFR